MDLFGSQDTILLYKYASKDSLWKNSISQIKISNNFKQNIDKSHSKQLKSIGKSIPAYWL